MSSFMATRRKCLSYLARRYFFQVREAQLMHVAINRRDTQNFKCLVALGWLTSNECARVLILREVEKHVVYQR